MRSARSTGHLHLLLSVAVVAVLAALFLFPGKARAAEPTFTDGTSTTRSVAENTASGEDIGTAVGATDTDTEDTLPKLCPVWTHRPSPSSQPRASCKPAAPWTSRPRPATA